MFDVHPDFAPVLGASPILKDAAAQSGAHQAGGGSSAVEAMGKTMEDVPEHYTRQPYPVEVVTESPGKLLSPVIALIAQGDAQVGGVGIPGAMVHVLAGGGPWGRASSGRTGRGALCCPRLPWMGRYTGRTRWWASG